MPISQASLQRLAIPTEPGRTITELTEAKPLSDEEIKRLASCSRSSSTGSSDQKMPPARGHNRGMSDDEIKMAARARHAVPVDLSKSVHDKPKAALLSDQPFTLNEPGKFAAAPPLPPATFKAPPPAVDEEESSEFGEEEPEVQVQPEAETEAEPEAEPEEKPAAMTESEFLSEVMEMLPAASLGNSPASATPASLSSSSTHGGKTLSERMAERDAAAKAACRPSHAHAGMAIYTPGGSTNESHYPVRPSSPNLQCNVVGSNSEDPTDRTATSPSSSHDSPSASDNGKSEKYEENLIEAHVVVEDNPKDMYTTAAAVEVQPKKCKTVHWLILAVLVIAIVVGVALFLMSGDKDSGSGSSIADTTTTDATATVPEGRVKAALITGALQDCFMEESVTSTGLPGSLAVADTASLIPAVNEARENRDCLFDVVVGSEDFHPKLHISFASTHGLPPFAHNTMGLGGLPITCMNTDADASCCPTYWVNGAGSQNSDLVLCPEPENMSTAAMDHVLNSPACNFCAENPYKCFSTKQAMWPDHCDQQTEAGIPKDLYTPATDVILKRGDYDYVDEYSSFMDNTRNIRTPLDAILKSHGINTIYLMGIAVDYGILYSASHAVFLKYNVKVVIDACPAIGEETADDAVTQMRQMGVEIITVADLLAMDCPAE